MERMQVFWRALDDRFGRVEPHPWGAVVTDTRFPDVWDANYARVERMVPRLTLAAIERALEPALKRAGAAHRHAVLFDPDAMASIVVAASGRGKTIGWDSVMTLDPSLVPRAAASVRAEEVLDVDEPFLRLVRSTLREFDVTDDRVADELMAIERAVLLPAGKRWFRIVAEGRTAALASLLRLGDDALVDHVVTLPFARRRGYAEAIVRHLARSAAEDGVQTLLLLTEPRGAAERLYERIGFRRARTIASLRARRAARPRPGGGD